MTQWASETERLQYEWAAEQTKDMPVRDGKHWLSKRLEKIVELATGESGPRGNPTRAMPKPSRMTQPDREEWWNR